jgi:hypothetical protein
VPVDPTVHVALVDVGLHKAVVRRHNPLLEPPGHNDGVQALHSGYVKGLPACMMMVLVSANGSPCPGVIQTVSVTGGLARLERPITTARQYDHSFRISNQSPGNLSQLLIPSARAVWCAEYTD